MSSLWKWVTSIFRRQAASMPKHDDEVEQLRRAWERLDEQERRALLYEELRVMQASRTKRRERERG